MIATVQKRSGTSFDFPTLAEGWASAKIGDIADIVGGGTPRTSDESNFDGKGHAWITPADLSGFKRIYIARGKRSLSDNGLKSCSARIMPKGTVLMSSRAPIGYVAIAANPICTNQGFKSFVCHPDIVPEYVYFWIRFIKPQLETMGSGSTFLEISGSRAREIPVLVAPTAEQKRIVTKVEELLARVNAARAHLAKVQEILKRFRQSVLATACSGLLTEDWREVRLKGVEPAAECLKRILIDRRTEWESTQLAKIRAENKTPKSKKWKTKYKEPAVPFAEELPQLPVDWCWATVEQLASTTPRSIQSGPFGSNLHHSEFQENGVLAIGIDNVLEGKFSLGKDHRISDYKYRELEKYTARPLDVLITVMGTIGRCCVLPEDIETAIITKHVYRITVDRNIILPTYLMHALLGDVIVESQIREQIRGQTRPGINGKILKVIAIPTPPLREQDEIIRRVKSLFKLADAIEKRVGAATDQAEKLTHAILAKAFRGELVPTEAELARRESRSCESASALLAKMKAEMKDVMRL